MLNIDKELFQWEKGRFVLVAKNNPEITVIEFYNKKSKHSDEVAVEDGKAKIPNHLLKEALPIVALACVEEGDSTSVITRKTFKVLARPQPEFYVDDEDDPVIPDEPDTPEYDIIYDGGEIV